jgi:hypothetical protein
MLPETPSITQLSQIIAQITAPAFLLGAVAAFVSVLIGRMNRIVDRTQALNAIADDDTSRVHLKSHLPRLKRRAELLNQAILFSTVSAIVTSLLVIVAFATRCSTPSTSTALPCFSSCAADNAAAFALVCGLHGRRI